MTQSNEYIDYTRKFYDWKYGFQKLTKYILKEINVPYKIKYIKQRNE